MPVSYANNGAAIVKAYQSSLGRSPTSTEIQNWVNHTNAHGGSMATITQGIANSAEARNYAARQSASAAPAPAPTPRASSGGGGGGGGGGAARADASGIKSAYSQYLGRSASDSEIKSWQDLAANSGYGINGIIQGIATSKEANDYRSGLSSARDQYAGLYESEAAGRAQDYADYQKAYAAMDQGYQDQISGLQTQYQDALGQASAAQSQVQEFQDKLDKQQAEFEAQQQALDDYKQRDVGMSLAGLRSGASSGGGNSTIGYGGSLASGRATGSYGGGGRSLTGGSAGVAKEFGSVIANKGPVVQQINSSSSSSSSSRSNARERAALASGGGASYYASRFS